MKDREKITRSDHFESVVILVYPLPVKLPIFVGRIFNILADCEQPEKVYYLGNSSSSDRNTNSDFASPSRIAIVLGDTAVSFDFGSVVLPKDASTENQVGLGGYCTPLWPIYVLQGNGEVYRMLTSLDTRL